VIAHGNDLARGIEDGAGVVAALLNVGRKRSAAQRGSHLFGDGMVEILEDFEFDGITHVGKFTSMSARARERSDSTEVRLQRLTFQSQLQF
jgi:hypothetical protein